MTEHGRHIATYAALALAGPVVAVTLLEIDSAELSSDSYTHGRVRFAAVLCVVWSLIWTMAIVRELRGGRND